MKAITLRRLPASSMEAMQRNRGPHRPAHQDGVAQAERVDEFDYGPRRSGSL
ncbi:hypothetical protein [Mycobacterium colombiense]|uniref:hypothetical protein n=1 Tax=Mycobacterium colombiense TaxID=339268 RepID=UPI0015C53BD6|nr:hypothetical protein [Mycobacterium colombiense]